MATYFLDKYEGREYFLKGSAKIKLFSIMNYKVLNVKAKAFIKQF